MIKNNIYNKCISYGISIVDEKGNPKMDLTFPCYLGLSRTIGVHYLNPDECNDVEIEILSIDEIEDEDKFYCVFNKLCSLDLPKVEYNYELTNKEIEVKFNNYIDIVKSLLNFKNKIKMQSKWHSLNNSEICIIK